MSNREKTPDILFQLFILGILIKVEGKAESSLVLERIKAKWGSHLSASELESHEMSGTVKWENDARWARKHLQTQGYLKEDSPRGIWEITYEGRLKYKEWSESLKKDLAGEK